MDEEQQEQLILEGIEPDEIDFDGKDLERHFTNKDTNR